MVLNLTTFDPASDEGISPGRRSFRRALSPSPSFRPSRRAVQRPGSLVQVVREPNITGNDRDVIVSRGATGADTATTDSAAGGTANWPEQAIPNGSARGR